MSSLVKICGISDAVGLAAAIDGGADMIGFVFYPRSPRYVSPGMAAALGKLVPPGVRKVGVMVDPSDQVLKDILARAPLDVIQLHGHENPERVAEIRRRFGLPVMSSVPVGCAGDVNGATQLADAADMLLFDTAPTANDTRPGGNARSFDWTLLHEHEWTVPWMISGGLNAANVAEALRRSGARGCDVSSGVEIAPGEKDPEKIAEFLKAAKSNGAV